MSNFSFYYAHHMSTIEGGMISTDSKKIYELSRILRSHGMVREIKDKSLQKYYFKKYKDLSEKFIFLYDAFNMRNNEVGAILGINQLKNLDKNNKIRSRNLDYFLKNIDGSKYLNTFRTKGSSNYAFPLIIRKKSLDFRKKLEDTLNKLNIEFRRGGAGGGNQLRQPYLKKYKKGYKKKNFKNVDHMHFFGYYIGNFPKLKKEKIFQICQVLNKI